MSLPELGDSAIILIPPSRAPRVVILAYGGRLRCVDIRVKRVLPEGTIPRSETKGAACSSASTVPVDK